MPRPLGLGFGGFAIMPVFAGGAVMPMAVPAPVIAPPMGVPLALPRPPLPLPSFEGVIPESLLPAPVSFPGTYSEFLPLQPGDFSGTFAGLSLPQPINFAGVNSGLLVSLPIIFEGVNSGLLLPQQIDFLGAGSFALLPALPDFSGILPAAGFLPGLYFEQAVTGINLPGVIMPEAFSDTYSLSQLPRAFNYDAFRDVAATSVLSEPVSFADAASFAALPPAIVFDNALTLAQLPAAAIGREDFSGIVSEAVLPAPKYLLSLADVSSQVLLAAGISPEVFREAFSSLLLPVEVGRKGVIFDGARAGSIIPEISFENILVSLKMPEVVSPREFAGINSQAVLSRAALFKETIPGINLPAAIPKPSFKGIIPGVILTEPVRPQVFMGAAASARLPVFAAQELSAAIVQKNLPLPLNPVLFREVTGAGRIRVMFPSGQQLIPTFGMGVPLGVEKQVMEPRIKEKEEE